MSLPLKVRARICPKGIHFTDAHIWVWGWMLGVGGGNWFNVSEAMPAVHNTQKTATEEGCGRRGVCVCVCVRVGRATWVTVASNKSNHLPSRQLVLFWSLKLLMRKKTWGIVICIHRYWATSTWCPLSHSPVSSLVAHLDIAIRCRFKLSSNYACTHRELDKENLCIIGPEMSLL